MTGMTAYETFDAARRGWTKTVLQPATARRRAPPVDDVRRG
jgi:hypothetical protein